MYDQARYGLTKLRQLWRVMHLGSNSYAMQTADGTAAAGLGVVAGTYSTSTKCQWTMELFTGVVLYKKSVMMPYTSAPTRAVELGIGRNVSAMDLMVVVSGAPDNDQTVNWRTGDSSVATVSTSGTVTGNARGTLSIYAWKNIGSTIYQVRIQVDVYETIYVKNYYDSSIEDDADLLGYIPETITFLNAVYKDTYHLIYVMDGGLQKYDDTVLNQCDHGLSEACNNKDCGTDCDNHHKSIHRIAHEAYGRHFERNHVVVLWRNSDKDIFCSDSEGQHAVGSPFAVVVGEDGKPIPVVQVLKIQNRDTMYGTCDDISFMKVTLAHEISHTLGLEDRYKIDEHGEEVGIQCLMEEYRGGFLDGFCAGIEGVENDAGEIVKEAPFCASCAARLDEVILLNAYES